MEEESKEILKPSNANEHCPGIGKEESGKSSACDGCPNQSACASGTLKIDPDIEKIGEKLKNVKHKVLVLSGKGGVGKSTVSSQLAFMLAKADKEVGLLDIDICGPSIPQMLGALGEEVHQSLEGWSPVYVDDNLAVMSIGFLLQGKDDAVIWRGPRKNGLIKQFLMDVAWGPLDFLVIDTPPGTSDEHISSIQYLRPGPNDGAIIVTTPQEVALADVRKEINFCMKTGTRILGVIENMSGFVCPSCKCETQIFMPTSGGAKKMCEELKLPFLGAIPMDPVVMMSAETGKCVADQAPDSKTAERYQEITIQLMELLKEI